MRTDRLHRRRRGMTFAEVLAAMLFAAIVLPATMGGVLLANRLSTAAVRRLDAAMLADRVLHEVIGTRSYQSGDDSGDFGEQWPGYAWTLKVDTWDVESLPRVTVTVSYLVQGRTFEESLVAVVFESQEATS